MRNGFLRDKSLNNNWQSILYGFFLVNALWLIFALLLQSPILPNPLTVYENLPRIFLHQQILFHLGHSLWRMFVALVCSVFLGLVMGLLMAKSRFGDLFLTPFVYFSYPIPKIALLPAVMLIFGLGDLSKIILITLIIVFQIAMNVRDSVKDIPKETYHVLVCLGASPWQLLREVTLPAALSQVLSGIRVALATILSVLFITETYGTRFGMGFYIMDAWMRIDYVDLYSGIVVLSFLGFLLFFLVDLMEKNLVKWK